MLKHMNTRLILPVCKNNDRNDNGGIAFVTWHLDEDAQSRLIRLAKIAYDEKILIKTEEFPVFEENFGDSPLKASVSISDLKVDAPIDFSLPELHRDLWPVQMVSKPKLSMRHIMLAMSPPNHIKKPVAIALPDCGSILLVFDEAKLSIELADCVSLALDAFATFSDGTEALQNFLDATGLENGYHSPEIVDQEVGRHIQHLF